MLGPALPDVADVTAPWTGDRCETWTREGACGRPVERAGRCAWCEAAHLAGALDALDEAGRVAAVTATVARAGLEPAW